MSIQRVRYGIGALGVLVGLYGAYLLLSRQDLDQLVSVAIWLVAGVVLHDVVLAPVVLLLARAFRDLPAAWRRPTTVAVIVLGTLSVVAIPVLTGLGARPDNPTLLDRPYGWSWVGVALVSVVLVVVAGLIGSRTDERRGGERGQGPGGR